jgi:activator of 2-hydroxyglutaryl-CoA dehydratase
MTKIYLDAGTSWSKVLEIYKDESELLDSPLNCHAELDSASIQLTDKTSSQHGQILNQVQGDNPKGQYKKRVFLFPSKFFHNIDIKFDGATGHMVKDRVKPDGLYQNEMLSLAYGAKKLLSEEDLKDATIVDIGSRDLKWVRFIDGKYKDLDWNGSCGSVTGATVEMLSKFYSVDSSELPPQKEKIPVTCGVFAMEKIMDEIVSNTPPEIAIAKYIHGIAYNTWNFAGSPNKIFLSGGFCHNQCFVESLKFYCEVKLLGRHVLLEGLY